MIKNLNNDTTKLLNRTNLKVNIDKFLKSVENNFQNLGNVKKYTPINEGYEDANFILETDRG